MSPLRAPDNDSKGRHWEAHACRHLQRQGLKVLHTRYRCRLGEIDIVCAEGDELVFVEVRSRAGRALVDALESIDHRKRQRILNVARHFLMCHPPLGSSPVRFDIVAIDDIDGASPRLRWLRNAFDAT